MESTKVCTRCVDDDEEEPTNEKSKTCINPDCVGEQPYCENCGYLCEICQKKNCPECCMDCESCQCCSCFECGLECECGNFCCHNCAHWCEICERSFCWDCVTLGYDERRNVNMCDECSFKRSVESNSPQSPSKKRSRDNSKCDNDDNNNNSKQKKKKRKIK